MCVDLTADYNIRDDSMQTDNGTCLEMYLSVFLQNARIANAQGDSRVLFYRGQSDRDYLLTPSVFRKGLLSKEQVLINDMLLNSPDEFAGISSILDRLIKMQHYSLPTRLLDISLNPLIALYFACCDSPGKDGEVFVFYDYISRPSDVFVRCLAALTEYHGSSERHMLGFLTDQGIHQIDISNLTSITYISIEAPLNNERIKRQHGGFIIVGISGNDNGNPYQKAVFDLRPFIVKDFGDGISRSIIIPSEDKPEVLKGLDALGINHGFLFPELEHQATYIRGKHEEA